MGRHSKLALLVAPFLILAGYILSDLYIEHQAAQTRIFDLRAKGHCDVLNQKCILGSGEFELNVYDKAGETGINTTFALDSAILFLVDANNEVSTYPLGMQDNPYYWQSVTPLRELIAAPGESYKLRLIANIKGGRYIGEFYTQTTR